MAKATETMTKKVPILALLLLLVCGAVMPLAAQVNGGTIVITPNGTTLSAPGDIIGVYENAASLWMGRLKTAAFDIFWTLAGVDFAWFAIELVAVYRMNHSVAAFLSMKKLATLGLFLALLGNADSWMPLIVNTFVGLGQTATGIQSITPSDVLALGLSLAATLMKSAVKSSLTIDLAAALAFLIAAAGIMISFTWLTAQFVIAKVETILALGLGYIFLAFGGAKWTTPYVERYWTFAVSAGIKLMSQYLLLGIGSLATVSWATQVNSISFWSLNVDIAWSVLSGALIYVMVCWHCSKLASSVLGGSPSLTASDAIGLIGSALSGAAFAGSFIPGLGAVTSTIGSAAGKAVSAAANSAGSGSAPPVAASAPAAAGAGAAGSAAAQAGSAPGMAARVGAFARVVGGLPHAGSYGANAPRFGGFTD